MNLQELQAFCYVGEGRGPWIHAPFRFLNYTLATDGKVLLRVPLIEGTAEPSLPESEFAAIGQYVALLSEVWLGAPLRLPELPPLSGPRPCEKCGGTGVQKGGTCWWCDGDKVFDEQNIPVRIGRDYYSHLLLHRLVKLPGLVFFNGVERGAVARFAFNGGCGVIKPCFWPAGVTGA